MVSPFFEIATTCCKVAPVLDGLAGGSDAEEADRGRFPASGARQGSAANPCKMDLLIEGDPTP